MREVVFPIFLFNVFGLVGAGDKGDQKQLPVSPTSPGTPTHCWSRSVLTWAERFCCELLFACN